MNDLSHESYGEITGKRPGWFTSFLIWVSGHCPAVPVPDAEKLKLAALGMALFVPVSISAFGAYATTLQASESQPWAIFAAFLVGGFTFAIDRALLSSSSGHLAAIGFRVALTLVSSTVFAHTALLWLFAGKIGEAAEHKRKAELQSITSRFRSVYDLSSSPTSYRISDINGQIETISAELKSCSTLLGTTSEELTGYRLKYRDEVDGRGQVGFLVKALKQDEF